MKRQGKKKDTPLGKISLTSERTLKQYVQRRLYHV